MTPLLVIRDADGSERSVELRDGVMRIGRAAGNEIVIGDASKGVSRTHAELHVENGRCTIVDLHSQNGTWVNALRVQRAEVRPDAEIAIGVFRLRLSGGTTPSISATGHPPPRPQPATIIAPRPPSVAEATATADAFAARNGQRSSADGGARRDQPGADTDDSATGAAGCCGSSRKAETLVAAVHLRRHRGRRDDRAGRRVVQPSAETIGQASGARAARISAGSRSATGIGAAASSRAGDAAAARSAESRRGPDARRCSTTRARDRRAGTRPTCDAAVDATSRRCANATTGRRRRARPRQAEMRRRRQSGSARGRVGAVTPGSAVRTTAENLPVPRKPGESLQDWQARSSALQARYSFAKVALERGDFAAASGGFAAILLEEPGFLDAPQLLVKAREGLRAAAVEVIEAGNKLDAAGDSIGALKKYDQAREIDRAAPGLDEAVKRVREKMRAAGTAALRRARQFDALGRFADALTEYEKAAQWLSPEDPNQQIARGRADQLKARQR